MARVKLKMTGIRKTLRDRGVQSQVSRIAKSMADEAGEGFEMQTRQHTYTSRAYVWTDNDSDVGRLRQANEHVLEKVAGRRGLKVGATGANRVK